MHNEMKSKILNIFIFITERVKLNYMKEAFSVLFFNF